MSTVTEDISRDDSAPAEPFHLVFDQSSSDPTMNIGICVPDSEQMKQWIKDNDVLDPHLLIVAVSPAGNEYERKLVPLTTGFVHVAFRRAGTFKLYAMIVHEPSGDRRQMKHVLLDTNSWREYSTKVISGRGNVFRKFVEKEDPSSEDEDGVSHIVNRHPHVARGEVVVGANNFAKQRAAWRTKLVATFFRNKGRDECNWRKRWLTSLALCVIWLPLQYLIKAVALVIYGSTGFVYKLDMKQLVKPGRRGSIIDNFSNVSKKSWWWYKRVDDSFGSTLVKRSANWRLFIFGVWFWTCLTILLWLGSNIPEEGRDYSNGFSLWESVMISTAVMLAICLLFGLFFLGWWIMDGLRNLLSSPDRRERRAVRRAAREETRIERWKAQRKDVEHQLDTMSCTRTGEPMTIDKLVNRQRFSRAVIWNRTKDAVCRPFQE